ncbi:MAG: hypothetical protein M3T55_07510 [Pseudomonadota bacterium]|nr:hypothetical protein [Pseudomonadota bacterium]
MGRQYGVEFNAGYNRGPLSTYASFAWARNQGEDIVSSQFNSSAADLAYIADHFIYLDHDQTFTPSADASYLWRGRRIGGDLILGSGLHATAPGGVPNGEHLPGYVQVNLAHSHRFENALPWPHRGPPGREQRLRPHLRNPRRRRHRRRRPAVWAAAGGVRGGDEGFLRELAMRGNLTDRAFNITPCPSPPPPLRGPPPP